MKSYTITNSGIKRKPRICKVCKGGEIDFSKQSEASTKILLKKEIGGMKHSLFRVYANGVCVKCRRLLNWGATKKMLRDHDTSALSKVARKHWGLSA